MEPTTILQAVGLLIVLVGVGGGTLAYYRQQRSEATIEIQSETIEAQERRLSEYRDQQVDDSRKIDRLRAEVAEVRRENALLREMVTGTAALTHLTEQVAELARDTNRRYTSLTDQHKEILRLLGGRRDVDH